MAYETGVPSSQFDLLDKLTTFLTGTPGWTLDYFDSPTKRVAVHKSTVFVQFKYDANSSGSIGLFHSLGNDGSVPGSEPDDSGNGQTSAGTITSERRMSGIGNGPFVAYHFFADPTYCHVALEYQSGLFRHCSFGKIDKIGDWTGGEYCAGHVWDPTATGLDFGGHACLVDWGNTNDAQIGATFHCEGLPSGFQGVSKWMVIVDGAGGNDRAGNPRMRGLGGWREGFYQNAIGHLEANPNNGYVPMFPLQVWRTRRDVTPHEWLLLGHLPAIRFVNLEFLNPGDEFTVGPDTWKVFPWVRKTGTTNQLESGNMGVAYLKT